VKATRLHSGAVTVTGAGTAARARRACAV